MQNHSVRVFVPERNAYVDVWDAETMGQVKDRVCEHLSGRPADFVLDEVTMELRRRSTSAKQGSRTNYTSAREKKAQRKKRTKHGLSHAPSTSVH